MDIANTLSAADILALPEQDARKLFAGEAGALNYRRLLRRWHPDRNPDLKAGDVFVQVQRLYGRARGLPGKQAGRSHLLFTTNDGKTFRFAPLREQEPFELGSVLLGRGKIAFLIQPDHRKMAEQTCLRLKTLKYSSAEMRTQLAPSIPLLHSALAGPKGTLILLEKEPDEIRLSDLTTHLLSSGKTIEAVHVGWILNCLYNLACYLSHAKVAHHAITPENIWINPAAHSVRLVGGWWYCREFGDTVHFLPASAAAAAPRSYLEKKTSSARLDLELIKMVGRHCLGDSSGMNLAGAPPAITQFLRLPATTAAVEEYRAWKGALLSSFGPPKFVPLEVSHSDVYKENYHG